MIEHKIKQMESELQILRENEKILAQEIDMLKFNKFMFNKSHKELTKYLTHATFKNVIGIEDLYHTWNEKILRVDLDSPFAPSETITNGVTGIGVDTMLELQKMGYTFVGFTNAGKMLFFQYS